MKESKCKGCGAPIVWGICNVSGKKIPLDLRPQVYRLSEQEGEVLAIRQSSTVFGVSHFATCPKANNFSGQNRKVSA